MAGAGNRRGWRAALAGLLPRIALLLTFSLLPVGLATVVQTLRAEQAAREAAAAVLIARTIRAATPQTAAIHSATERARGLAAAIAVLDPTVEDCIELMRRAVRDWEHVPFAGIVMADGELQCAARDPRFTDDPTGLDGDEGGTLAQGAMRVESTGATDGLQAILAVVPVPDTLARAPGRAADGQAAGTGPAAPEPGNGVARAVALALIPPGDGLPGRDAAEARAVVITFNRRGEVLTSSGIESGALTQFLPRGVPLDGLVSAQPEAFAAETVGGLRRGFAVVPLVGGEVFALGSWPGAAAGLPGAPFAPGALLLPVMLWLAGIGVALLALNQIVLRHLGTLRTRMNRFASRRRLDDADGGAFTVAPAEIRDMAATFERMAAQVLRDEAELEHAMRERGVLLRELHHRVKNNLQLISSMLNMQLRRATDRATATELRTLQDRITSLAAIHRGLWQAPSLTRVRIDTLIGDLGAAHDPPRGPRTVETALDPAILGPDEAAALAMLAAEAIGTAARHVAQAGHPGPVRVSLSRPEGPERGELHLSVTHPLGKAPGDDAPTGDADIGRAMIGAFAAQLGGAFGIDLHDGAQVVWFRFTPRPTDTPPDPVGDARFPAP